MNRDSQLIFEAYKKVDPNDHRFPIKPKFTVGQYVVIKRYHKREFIGKNNYSSINPEEDYKTTIYKDVLGQIKGIRAFTNYTGAAPTYYYDTEVVDKRFPAIGTDLLRTYATYELNKTNLTPQDTGNIVDILDI